MEVQVSTHPLDAKVWRCQGLGIDVRGTRTVTQAAAKFLLCLFCTATQGGYSSCCEF